MPPLTHNQIEKLADRWIRDHLKQNLPVQVSLEFDSEGVLLGHDLPKNVFLDYESKETDDASSEQFSAMKK